MIRINKIVRVAIITFFVAFYSNNAISKPPQRIISLMPTVTEELFLLGLGDNIIGRTMYCIRPLEAAKIEKVAVGKEVSLEKIISLRPNVILASFYTDPKAMRKLESLGLKVVKFEQALNFDQICENFLKLSIVVDKETLANEIVKAAKNKVKELEAEVFGYDKPNIFIQIGAKPLFAIGRDSPVNDLFKVSGTKNILGDRKSSVFSREEVIKQDPEYIFMVTMGAVDANEKKIWQQFKRLRAVKEDKLFVIDSNRVCSSTPVTFAQVASEFVDMIHKGNDE